MSAALDLCDGIACGSARIVTAENGTRPATESFTSSGDLDDANTRGELPVDDDDNLASADEEVELSMSARLRLVRNRQVGKSLANEGRLHEEGALLAIPPPTRYTRKRKKRTCTALVPSRPLLGKGASTRASTPQRASHLCFKARMNREMRAEDCKPSYASSATSLIHSR
eukprot:3940475-Rhodomonas_salina.1